jgi:hypothetical protein
VGSSSSAFLGGLASGAGVGRWRRAGVAGGRCERALRAGVAGGRCGRALRAGVAGGRCGRALRAGATGGRYRRALRVGRRRALPDHEAGGQFHARAGLGLIADLGQDQAHGGGRHLG